MQVTDTLPGHSPTEVLSNQITGTQGSAPALVTQPTISGTPKVGTTEYLTISDNPSVLDWFGNLWRNFAFTPLGAGPVLRAIENSSIAPPAERAAVRRLSRTDLAVLWPEDHGWPQDIGLLAILGGAALWLFSMLLTVPLVFAVSFPAGKYVANQSECLPAVGAGFAHACATSPVCRVAVCAPSTVSETSG